MQQATGFALTLALVSALAAAPSRSQDDDALAAMARKAQDPLADIKAVMSDNTVGFGAGPSDDTAYGFQIQPVYSIDNESRYNVIARGILPVVGVDRGTVLPPLGPNPRPAGDTWGLSDPIVQLFFAPKSDAAWKWGVGPQVSIKARSSDRQAGAGWGAGFAGVVFGSVGNWALGAVGMQHWGDEDDFSLASVQWIAMYNFESMPGVYAGYSNSMTYNWQAESGDKLMVPLGVTVGRTLLLSGGNGLDVSVGVYDIVERPSGSPEWQLKLGLSYFFN